MYGLWLFLATKLPKYYVIVCLFIMFVLPVLPCKRKTSYRKSCNLRDENAEIWSYQNDMKQNKHTIQKFVKSIEVNLCLADFINLGPLCRKRGVATKWIRPRPCPLFSFCIYIYCKCEKKQGICKTCLRVFWKNINDYLLVTKAQILTSITIDFKHEINPWEKPTFFSDYNQNFLPAVAW